MKRIRTHDANHSSIVNCLVHYLRIGTYQIILSLIKHFKILNIALFKIEEATRYKQN